MIYSCFDELTGLYRYFQDEAQVPVNGDLPIPPLALMAGTVGVPAREAGRPLPLDAVEIGSGPRAKGMVVRCDGGLGLSAFSLDGTSATTWAMAAGLAVAGYLAVRYLWA